MLELNGGQENISAKEWGRLRDANEFARQHFEERGIDFDKSISELAGEALERPKDEELDEGGIGSPIASISTTLAAASDRGQIEKDSEHDTERGENQADHEPAHRTLIDSTLHRCQ